MIKIFVTISLFVISVALNAQTNDPVKWRFNAVKKSEKVYEIALSAALIKPWHIYSQFTPDGGPLPTKITFVANPLLSVDGGSKEKGNLKTNHDANFGVDVKYFSDKVEFVQAIKMKGTVQTVIRGNIEYMVCNDEKCLPPVKQSFDIKLQ